MVGPGLRQGVALSEGDCDGGYLVQDPLECVLPMLVVVCLLLLPFLIMLI